MMLTIVTREEAKQLFKEAPSIGEMHHGYCATLKTMEDVL
jgi:hypothetical protein